MQGKVLIVDAISTNRIVLKVKLATAYYQVLQASTVAEAAKLVLKECPDLIICALQMPDGDAARLRAVLAAHPRAQHIPILAMASPPALPDRLEALKAGVRDVLMKPVDDTLLLGRVRSLIRDHNTSADWRMRDDTYRALGLAEPPVDFGHAGHCMMVSADPKGAQSWMLQLRPKLRSKLSHSQLNDVLRNVQSATPPDVFVLILPSDPEASSATLRLIATLRANAATRNAGVLVLQVEPDAGLAANALDMGADDLMTDGFDLAELSLRLRAVIRRIRMAEQLRRTVRTGLQAAVFDPLTGLNNRRYAMPHLSQAAAHANATGRPLAVMVADLDHFKNVNDQYGHASGDAVLIEVANRLREGLRGSDMVARIGGEEFLMIMPGTEPDVARETAIRLCGLISATPFEVPGHTTAIPVTISIGLALCGRDAEGNIISRLDGADLLDQADKALYAAKMRGRNCVTLSRPAA